jgi:PAS domain S-box-containing protein
VLWQRGAIVVAVGVVFAADTVVAPGSAVRVLYVLPVLASSALRRPVEILYTAALCSLLTVIGFFVGSSPGDAASGLLDPALAIVAIVTTAGFGLYYRRDADALRSSADRADALFANPYELVGEIDQEWRCLACSPNHEVVLGYSLKGRLLSECIHPDDFEATRASFEALWTGDSVGPVTFRFLKADGSYLWEQGSAASFETARGERRAIFVTRDITESRESVRDLRESEDRGRVILNTAADAIITVDEAGTIESANRATADLFGYEEGDLVGHNVRMLMPPPFVDEHDGYLERYHRTGEARIIGIGRDVQGLRRDGVVFPIRLSIGEARLEDGSRLYTGVIHDLTERVAAEAQAARLGTILENSLNEVFVFDDESLRFSEVNRGARDNLGYALEELQSMTPVDIKPEYDMETFRALIEPLRSGSVPKLQFNTVHRRKDGSEYRVEVHLQHRVETGEFVAIILDTTDREILERQLLQAQKMQAIGTLAGGIAHDFNNLLTSIRGSSEILLEHLEPGGRLARSASRIERAADRAAALTTQLLGFSRKQVTRRTAMDIRDAVREVRDLFVRTLPEDVELKTDLDAGALYVVADPSQIAQVLMNLVVNARDAMSHGGTLLLQTGREPVSGRRAVGLDIAPGEYAAVRVRDTGEGIAPETLEQIFDPFFTTKEVGKGTGLGLATAFGIIREHGGALEVESEVGVGTTMTVLLPVHEAAVVAPSASELVELPERGSGATVLLVEDDDIMRDLLREVLQEAGYRVVSAAHPDEALASARAHDGEIDLVVTDVVMPKRSGFLLAKELRQEYPGIRTLYMSGYTDQELADRGQLSDDDPFIRKPFGNDVLLAKVREVLEARGSPA